jgi:hypothetical protein
MPELPELPRAVRKPSKAMVIGGVAAVAVIGYLWWRNRSATTTTPDATIDPLTGLPYSAEANAGATGGNAGVGASGLSDTIDASGTGIHDQASWTADAVAKLGGSYEQSAIYDALGAYLAGQPINSDQAVIVRSAWAASGKWPFIPASYTLATTGSTPGTGGGATPITPAAPTATSVTRTSVKLATATIPGATKYEWAVNGADHAHTSGPAYTYSARPGTTYQFSVRAVVSGHDTAQSASTTVTTKE